jgi:hypothetical protein
MRSDYAGRNVKHGGLRNIAGLRAKDATEVLCCVLAFCWLGMSRVEAQVVLSSDFSSFTDFRLWGLSGTYSGGSPPAMTADLFDAGSPNGSVLMLSVDSSQTTGNWGVSWDSWPVLKTFPQYDPARTYVNFEASISKLKPFYVKLEYLGGDMDIRNLEIHLTPTVVDSFQRYSIPLSSFAVTYVSGSPPDVPTVVSFGIGIDGTNYYAAWGSGSNNVLMIDNLSYFVVPPSLSIGSSNGSAVVSWATDTIPYVLEQNSDLNTTNWIVVTNIPVVADEREQVVVSSAVGRNFYRLRSP